MMAMPIEISREGDGWKVWFGTFATDRSRTFPTPEAAEEFAKAKFAKARNRFILYPKDWEALQ